MSWHFSAIKNNQLLKIFETVDVNHIATSTFPVTLCVNYLTSYTWSSLSKFPPAWLRYEIEARDADNAKLHAWQQVSITHRRVTISININDCFKTLKGCSGTNRADIVHSVIEMCNSGKGGRGLHGFLGNPPNFSADCAPRSLAVSLRELQLYGVRAPSSSHIQSLPRYNRIHINYPRVWENSNSRWILSSGTIRNRRSD